MITNNDRDYPEIMYYILVIMQMYIVNLFFILV
jgi:hypothetical protein